MAGNLPTNKQYFKNFTGLYVENRSCIKNRPEDCLILEQKKTTAAVNMDENYNMLTEMLPDENSTCSCPDNV